MKLAKAVSGPVPESIKNRTREEFLARSNLNALSHDDLYWVLYRAATDAPGSADSFGQAVSDLLTASLGAGNFDFSLAMTPNGHGGVLGYQNDALANCVYWGGDAGVLPGFGASNSITCVVFWR
ncbi:hypothetical protein [Corallococcus carmarthensis]|uniref:Uncharacterized protein n=1 Tax=Corallococcus carmarthensis TaxID=2316728 RepID=A0A3A8KJE5_9BACT|nr:hypothetical protein [Corallococcus carmarthensis]NOK15855.1 hypothetical protein [Corallococcus carmarthensis]RKH07477.1 hypothetical protein D7X32_01555 [Corallococcus carmarthensis]